MVLPWAKEKEPEKYQSTLKVAAQPATFRNYLLRLLEIMVEKKAIPMGQLPLSLLDETSLCRVFRHRPTGKILEVRGKKAKGTRTWGWFELANDPADIATLIALKEALDLEIHNDAKPI